MITLEKTMTAIAFLAEAIVAAPEQIGALSKLVEIARVSDTHEEDAVFAEAVEALEEARLRYWDYGGERSIQVVLQFLERQSNAGSGLLASSIKSAFKSAAHAAEGEKMTRKPNEHESSVLCEHAKEMPHRCPCPSHCYCKSHSCKSFDAVRLRSINPVTPEREREIWEKVQGVRNQPSAYEGYDWIKVPQWKEDADLSILENYLALKEHHKQETEFLIRKVRELAEELETKR